MFLPNYSILKCQTHDKPIYGICINQKCKKKEKVHCADCGNKNIHFGCQIKDLSDVPKLVEDHSISFKNTKQIVIDLENWFQGITTNLKQVLEGYQVSDIFQCISESQDLNSLATILFKFPKVIEKIKEISQLTRKSLENYFQESTDMLQKYQQNDLNKTILQRSQTNNLLLTQRIQNNVLQLSTQQQKDPKIEQLLENGKSQLQNKNFKKAIDYFEQIRQIEPQNRIVLQQIMIALKKLDYYNSSLLISQTIQENLFDNVFLKGQVLYKQKQYSQAIQEIENGIKDISSQLDQNQLEKINYLLFKNYLKNGQLQDAEEISKKLGDSNIKILKEYAKFNVQDEKLDQAEQYLLKMSQINKNDIGNKKIQIQIYYKKGEYKNCLLLIDELLGQQLKAKDKENLKNLKIKLYYLQEKYDEAMASWLNFFYINEDDFDTNLIIGQCLSYNKMYYSAKLFFDKILMKSINHTQAINQKKYVEEQIKKLNSDQIQTQTGFLKLSASSQNFRIKNKTTAQSQICFTGRNYTDISCESSNSKLSQFSFSQIDLPNLVKILVDYNLMEVSKLLDQIIQSIPIDPQLLLLEAKFYIKNINEFTYQEKLKVQKKIQKSLHYLITQSWNNNQLKLYQEAQKLQQQLDININQTRPQTTCNMFPNINRKQIT